MPFALANGIRLRYELYAPHHSGPALVLLHGLGSCADDWSLQLPAFTCSHRVLAVDLRGHGQSDNPEGRYTVPLLASDVAALLAQLNDSPAHLVGLSLGGTVALQLAIDCPELVLSLTLVNTFARLRPAGVSGALRFIARGLALRSASMDSMARTVAASLFPKPGQTLERETATRRIAANDLGAYRRAVSGLLAFDARRQLSRVAAPTLVIAGERDRVVPLSCKRELQRGIPGARLAVIPDSGHASNIDQPERLNELVLEFVGNHPDADERR